MNLDFLVTGAAQGLGLEFSRSEHGQEMQPNGLKMVRNATKQFFKIVWKMQSNQ